MNISRRSLLTAGVAAAAVSAPVVVSAATVDANRVMTTPDGVTWNAWKSINWSPELGLFVGVDASGRIATSPDKMTWTWQRTCH